MHELWLELKFHSIQFNSGLTEELDSNLIIELNWIEFKYIDWNLNEIELNWIPVQLNSIQIIELRFNWEKLKCKLVKRLLKICVAYDVGK